uniref:SRCR domain-containing protein n=1 Tax=Accipiter nisus TaxID=211598 RepID=A0A8B9N5X4_9AVES
PSCGAWPSVGAGLTPGARRGHGLGDPQNHLSVRLVNGGRRCAGRVEVKHNTVICKQLGCESAVGAPHYGHFGAGSGPIWMDDVGSNGTKSALSLGTPSGLGFFPEFVQLVEGKSRCSGRVEIHDGDQWNTVCDSHFGPKAADVVCRELQCGVALPVTGPAHFGEGISPIWDGELQCVGNESHLISCRRGSSRDQPCTHANSAVVTCTRKDSGRGVEHQDCASGWGTEQGLCWARCEDRRDGRIVCNMKIVQKENKGMLSLLPLRQLLRVHEHQSTLSPPPLSPEYTGFKLVNGSTACAGRVQVQVLGTWGTLCASRWDLSDAHVLCRQLNCGFAESIPGGEHFGRGTGPVWRDSFHCDGTEAHLGQCPVITLGASPCSQGNNFAVVCSGECWKNGSNDNLPEWDMGQSPDDQWDMQEVSVVCRQLRCREAEKAYNPPKPQRGTGPIGLQGVRCTGHEASLALCNTSLPESAPVAGVVEDVGVICWGSRRVWLVNGAGRCAGRVEIYYQGIWGTVCDDGWDLSDAAIVCHQLGCEGAVEAAGSAQFGEGSGQIWLDGVNCSGAEAALWDCPAGPWGQHDCGHKEDAGVICSEFVALRLENSDGCSGHLQIFFNGTWGSICSNSMTLDTVSLACKELGCGDGGSLETHLSYGRVSGPTWLDNVQCGEKTSSFWQCPSAPWNPQSCEDSREEIHITCNGNSEPPGHPSVTLIHAMGGEDRCLGRVEVWHRGAWGMVCNDSWDMRDAEVVCKQLGCGPVVSALHEAAFGMGTGPIWLEQVECQGTELSLQNCWAQPGDGGVCQHKEDAAVNCSDSPWGRLTVSGRVSVPVIICIILGALLCLLLALLAGQALSTRAGRRGWSFHSGPTGRYLLEALRGVSEGHWQSWEGETVFCHLSHAPPH